MPYVPTSGTRPDFYTTHTRLGLDAKDGSERLVSLTDRYSGMYVLGTQGMGKSGFLEGLIHQDAVNGEAIIVIDPHGQLTDDCIAQLPQSRINQTFILDMQDEEFPFGVNLFSHGKLNTDADRTQVIDRILHVFDALWEDVLKQQNLPMYLQMAVHALIDTPGTTLVDLMQFLLDDEYRASILNNPAVDPTVRNWWHTEYDVLKPDTRKSRVQPLLNRLYALFMGRQLMRNIVGQRHSTINFRKAVEAKQIIFVRLPVKVFKRDADLVGMVIMALIHGMLFSFADMPESQRPGFSLYIDEGQHFSIKDIQEMYTEGRKFGIRLVIANQYLGQLSGFLQEAVMTARTKSIFRTTLDDATTMGRLFHGTQTTTTPSNNPVRELLNNTPKDPTVRLFVEYYLRPLKHYTRRGNIEVRNKGDDLRGEVFDFFKATHHSPQDDKPEQVEDPTDALNSLFRDVMESASDYLPIDPIIPTGFCNAGIGFRAITRDLYYGHEALEPDVQWPLNLVHGRVWIKNPDSPREQFLHFIFSLRRVMAWLVDHPIGKTTESSNNAKVSQWLANMPPRMAFVQASDATYVIRTIDVPASVDRENLNARLHFIREHTRQTYCHPRDQVEAKPVVARAVAEEAVTAAEHSRWEDD